MQATPVQLQPDAPARTVDRYAVVGNPVAHSRSPFIHAAFAEQTGQLLDYGRLLATEADFAATLQRLAAEGGRGCNVTVPFKQKAFLLCPRRTPRAEMAQAANTLRFDAEGWLADNTDGSGLLRDMTVNAGFALAGRRVLLIGAGGAAAGVLGPLLEAASAAVTVANRDPAKAQALVARHAPLAAEHGVALTAAGLDAFGTGAAFDAVINATSSSLAGAQVPVSARVLRPGSLAVDLMYGPAAAGFIGWAEAHGAVGRDGLGMLVEQAAEAFALWRGVRPQTAPVLATLRVAVDTKAA